MALRATIKNDGNLDDAALRNAVDAVLRSELTTSAKKVPGLRFFGFGKKNTENKSVPQKTPTPKL